MYPTNLKKVTAILTNDRQAILEIFKFWYEKGFTGNKEMALFFMRYIAHTHKIKMVQLNQMLEESKIEGGETMQTLAQQLKKEGKKEEKLETAKRMLLNDFSVEQVMTATGLTEKQLKALLN